MSLSKPQMSTKMDCLPIDAIEVLCRYLSEKDIAFCSMVSRSWRETFNDDIIWKPLCSPRVQLHDTLRTTPCTVNPFTYDTTDSTLSTPCQWKVAHMKEKHLWHNIREGKCRETQIKHDQGKGFPIVCGFLSDELVYLIFDESMQVWNTGIVQAVLVFEHAHSFTRIELASFRVVVEDKNIVMVVSGFQVKLFQIDFQLGAIKATAVFDYDSGESKTIRRNNQMLFNENGVPKYFVTGSTFIGMNQGYSKKMHIWDLKFGNKMYEDEYDMPGFHVNTILGSLTSSNVAIVLQKVFALRLPFFRGIYTIGEYACVVYCLKEARLFPFKDVSSLTEYSCALLNDFVAIWDTDSSRVYNYKTCELIYKGEGKCSQGLNIWQDIIAAGEYFFFYRSHKFNVVSTNTKASFTDKFEANFLLVMPGILVLNELFFLLGKSCFQVSNPSTDPLVSGVSRSFQIVKDHIQKIRINDCHAINSSGTRYLCHKDVTRCSFPLVSQDTSANVKVKTPTKNNDGNSLKLVVVRQFW